MISGADPAVWSLLHDGTIVRIDGTLTTGELVVWIDLGALRARSPQWTLLGLRLVGCTEIVFRGRDTQPLTDLTEIAAHRPTIVEAQRDRGDVLVWCRTGTLRLHSERVAIELEMSGRLTEVAALLRARYPVDRTLPDSIAAALRHRS